MAIKIHNMVKPLLITALLITVIQIIACSDQNPTLVKGKPAPSFSLKNMQGKNVLFPEQFNNQLVIISFWADWCPSCYKEMREFETIFKQKKNQGLSILAINIKQDRDTALAFIDDLNISYELLLDTDGEIAEEYAVSSLPAAFIINKDGTLHTRVLGETPVEVFEQILRTLL